MPRCRSAIGHPERQDRWRRRGTPGGAGSAPPHLCGAPCLIHFHIDGQFLGIQDGDDLADRLSGLLFEVDSLGYHGAEIRVSDENELRRDGLILLQLADDAGLIGIQ